MDFKTEKNSDNKKLITSTKEIYISASTGL